MAFKPWRSIASFSKEPPKREWIITAVDQKFFCLNKGEWVRAIDLYVGSCSLPTLLMARDKILKLVFVSELKKTNSEMYVIHVEENHNFFVYGSGLLTHNFVVSIPLITWTFGGGISWCIPVELMLKGIGLLVLAKFMNHVGVSPSFTNIFIGGMDARNRSALSSMMRNNSFETNSEIPYIFNLKESGNNSSSNNNLSSGGPSFDPKPPKKDDDCKLKIAAVNLERKTSEQNHLQNRCDPKCNPETHLREIARDADLKKAQINADHKYGFCSDVKVNSKNKSFSKLAYFSAGAIADKIAPPVLDGIFRAETGKTASEFITDKSESLYKELKTSCTNPKNNNEGLNEKSSSNNS